VSEAVCRTGLGEHPLVALIYQCHTGLRDSQKLEIPTGWSIERFSFHAGG
jgi:hypothetical protein